jgi:hypothetical protein
LSEDTVKTPSQYTWQKVVYFASNKTSDTIFAFNKEIRLCNDVAIPPTTDTLIYWTTTDAAKDGFIPVSPGFYFKRKNQTPNFFIGMKYDSIPKGYTARDMRIYRYDAGKWYLDTNVTTLDSAAGIIYVKTRDLTYPFIAMIDTVRPTVTFVGTTDSAVVASQDIEDTFIVSDNISNMSCMFSYAKGENAYTTGDGSKNVLSANKDTITDIIPATMVSEDNGVRAIFVASDGCHNDTVNVSRQVIRNSKSDMVVTEALKWLPLHVTAVPDSPAAQSALYNLAVNGSWKYDNKLFRLFRWYPYSANTDTTDKWVEYADSVKNQFTFSPGYIIWLKTKTQTTVDFGRATTPSLKQAYKITLRPNGWTDIALPFKFNVFIKDIFSATAASGQITDSLQFYKWTLDTAGQYYPEVAYLHGIHEADTMVSDKNTGYCAYNSSNDTIFLYIPPTPVSMSGASSSKRHSTMTADGSYLLKITGHIRDGATLSPVYCGYDATSAQGVSLYSAPPQLASAAMGVCDGSKKFFGHEIVHGTAGGGALFNIAFVNTSGSAATIDYNFENMDRLPAGMSALLIDPETGKSAAISGAASVSVAATHTAYRNLAVGVDDYLAKVKIAGTVWKLGLSGAYPNPFSRSVRIHYTLPAKGINRITLSIINVFGKTVFEKTESVAEVSGEREFVWNGKDYHKKQVASGIYFVKMTALDASANRTGVFEKKITYLP